MDSTKLGDLSLSVGQSSVDGVASLRNVCHSRGELSHVVLEVLEIIFHLVGGREERGKKRGKEGGGEGEGGREGGRG